MKKVPALILLSLTLLASFGFAPLAAAGTPQPAWAQKLQEGKEHLENGQTQRAVKALRAADKQAHGSCLECQLLLAKAHNKLGAWRDVVKLTEAALAKTNDPEIRAALYNEQGLALFAKPGDSEKDLARAEDDFRQVLRLTDGNANAARFNLGYLLLKTSRDAEGVALLKEYLEKEPKGTRSDEARDLVANPLRARKPLLPNFALTTLAGTVLKAEDLQGKVVLLDFWGTWCPPCVAAVPALRDLSRRMESKPFVLVSIAANETDEILLRKFIQRNEMHWPQVWDKEGAFTQKLQVPGYPTYILADPTGEIVFVSTGWGQGSEQQLLAKIKSALQKAESSAQTP